MLQRYKIIHNSLFIINNFFVLLWLKFKNNSYFMDKKLRTGSLCVHAGYKAKNGEPIYPSSRVRLSSMMTRTRWHNYST